MKVDMLFFIHFEKGMETILIPNVEMSYIKEVEKRAKECGAKEMICWTAFDKNKQIVGSGIINKEEK